MSIVGNWYNELGSQMQLNVSGSNVWGTYYTAVGTASGQYPLTGQSDSNPSKFSQALGWAVAWNNAYFGSSHSSTSWSGQYQTVAGSEEIIAFWLLTTEVQQQDNWEATQVGQDVFTRTQPSEEDIAKARARRARSHPAAAAEAAGASYTQSD
ncbi:MAG TPA: avidin/streptavidin family protein [Pyrinomonadaceae bacterium]|jgi:hypothetical protein|nr:avidin/streptavidin family protein [Pyrinomonadaceae bacterium]